MNKSVNAQRREWISRINPTNLDLYPIQFANCDRLRINDAVYIFDEVGCGKTISSGLMAMDYLCEHKDSDVLVITTNALAKSSNPSGNGQFAKDWYEKLPFQELDLKSHIHITNNHHSHFSAEHRHHYGLVIIDEAHLFLNKETQRYQNLIANITADKVVFLTATPIKESEQDLETYIEIAETITKKILPRDWIQKLCTKTTGQDEKDERNVICNLFDISSPVTRYFKDTVMSINHEGWKESKTRRLLPVALEFDKQEEKDIVLLKLIQEKLEQELTQGDPQNRFVVFTRFVKNQACKLADYLTKNGFQDITKASNSSNRKTYRVVTGENAGELSNYSDPDGNLPTVLILTYQIAEQGVNLPGYNHVINYHISAFPSALEQRFGRIDRMNSKFEKIYMYFLISTSETAWFWDSNTYNFENAVFTYLRNLISYIPSKNTILSKDILEQTSNAPELIENGHKKFTNLIQQDVELNKLIDYLESTNSTQKNVQPNSDLLQFVDEHSIMITGSEERSVQIENLRKKITDALQEHKNDLKQLQKFSNKAYKDFKDFTKEAGNFINSVSNDIFYFRNEFTRITDMDLCTLDAINQCAKWISDSKAFQEYQEFFQQQVRLPLLYAKYHKDLNSYFEVAFIKNEFERLFPLDGYRNIFQQILTNEEFRHLSDEEKNWMIQNANDLVTQLPFFQMYSKFQTKLHSYANYKRFDFNPITSAICYVAKSENHRGISDEFYQKYFLDINGNKARSLLRSPANEENIIQASNWAKLSYHCTRKEEACFFYRCQFNNPKNFYWEICSTTNGTEINNPFFQIEISRKYIRKNYDAYQRACRNCHELFVKHIGQDYHLIFLKCSEVNYDQILANSIEQTYEDYQSVLRSLDKVFMSLKQSILTYIQQICHQDFIRYIQKNYFCQGDFAKNIIDEFVNCIWQNFEDYQRARPDHWREVLVNYIQNGSYKDFMRNHCNFQYYNIQNFLIKSWNTYHKSHVDYIRQWYEYYQNRRYNCQNILLSYIPQHSDDYRRICQDWSVICKFEAHRQQIFSAQKRIEKLQQQTKAAPTEPQYESLFHYFLKNNTGREREHTVMPVTIPKENPLPKVSEHDIWTQGMIQDLYPKISLSFCNAVSENLTNLPDEIQGANHLP